jgi:hypothetical protein
VIEWLVAELSQPLYTLGQPAEMAVAQCARIEAAELIKDLVRRGLELLDDEERKGERERERER